LLTDRSAADAVDANVSTRPARSAQLAAATGRINAGEVRFI
jgi:hypothetical protein